MTLCHTGLKWHKRVNEDRIVICLSSMLWIDCYWLLLPCAEWWDLQWALGLQAAAPAPSDWETLQRRRSSPVIVVSPLALPREQTVCSGSSRPAASPTSGPEPWNHTYNMHTHCIQYITIFIHIPSIFRGSNVIGQVNIIIDKYFFANPLQAVTALSLNSWTSAETGFFFVMFARSLLHLTSVVMCLWLSLSLVLSSASEMLINRTEFRRLTRSLQNNPLFNFKNSCVAFAVCFGSLFIYTMKHRSISFFAEYISILFRIHPAASVSSSLNTVIQSHWKPCHELLKPSPDSWILWKGEDSLIILTVVPHGRPGLSMFLGS